MSAPTVSVVTGVYNGGRFLRASLDSILAQEEVEFEFVIVDDGSTDDTPTVLAEFAERDRRVRVLRQANLGLTRALIRGCAEARGEFIARHDADDLSFPRRLVRQVQLLRDQPGVAMASCWSRTIGPEDEPLYEATWPESAAECTRLLVEGQTGPHHGSVLFRAADYHRVGGYRPEFRYTQDWDLWLRLVEVGALAFVPEILFALRVSEQSITSFRRAQQVRLAALANECRKGRLRGEDETAQLAEAVRICAEPGLGSAKSRVANSYFIGKCLLDRRDPRALKYLRRCVRYAPWNWRHWAALTGAAFLCRSSDTGGGPSRRP